MKKMTATLALLVAFSVTGCANTDVFSGDVYTASQAKEARSITYGTIVSVRPVKIQAENQGIIGGIGGGALGGIAGNAIGGSKIEEKMSQVNGAELVIKKDDGQEIVVVQKADSSFVAGKRVRIVGGGSDLNVSVL